VSRANTDRSLRRLVADMAALHADDVAAILGQLGAAERETVERLLKEYASFAKFPAAPTPAEPIAYDTSALSPWLRQRLEMSGNPRPAVAARLQQALRDHAARLFPVPVSVAGRPGRPSTLRSQAL
jgi:hypothetical protein